jgi:hypothetical protein
VPEPDLVDDDRAGEERQVVRGVGQRATNAVVEAEDGSGQQRAGEDPRRDLAESVQVDSNSGFVLGPCGGGADPAGSMRPPTKNRQNLSSTE